MSHAVARYIDSAQSAQEAMAEIMQHTLAGLDTEFYGCDITKESPVAKSICHVFSVATPSGSLNPRGYNEASSYVFAGALLTEPCVKNWLQDGRYKKAVHNQPVDSHTIRNHGVKLQGGINTLAMARYWYPARAKREGFDLDSLGSTMCGAGKTESFSELLGYESTEYREHEVTKKRCECGELGCTKKKPSNGVNHAIKTPEKVVVPYGVKVKKHIPLTDLSPQHALWSRYLAYAAWDAVLALWVYQLMLRDKIERPYPWQITI